MKHRPPSFMDEIQKQLDPDPELTAAQSKALDLFLEIREKVGDVKARSIFARWGTPPAPRRMQLIDRIAIIDRLDGMIKTDKAGNHVRGKDGMLVFEPNVKKLARQIAAETINNPTPTEIGSIERHIQKCNRERKENLSSWPRRGG